MKDKNQSIVVLKEAVRNSLKRGSKVVLFGAVLYNLKAGDSITDPISNSNYSARTDGIYAISADPHEKDRRMQMACTFDSLDNYIDSVVTSKSQFEIEVAMVMIYGRLQIKRLMSEHEFGLA